MGMIILDNLGLFTMDIKMGQKYAFELLEIGNPSMLTDNFITDELKKSEINVFNTGNIIVLIPK
jgi:hypothetical protein